MATSDTEFQVQALLLAFEALAFLVLAGWCAARLGPAWAGLGLGGGLLIGLATGISAAMDIETTFFQTAHLANVVVTSHTFTVLAIGRALGAALVVLAFVQRFRTPAR